MSFHPSTFGEGSRLSGLVRAAGVSGCPGDVTTSARSHASRRRVPWHLEPLAGIRDLGPVHSQDREVLIEVVAHEQVSTIWRENSRLGQATDLDLFQLADLLTVNLQNVERPVLLVKIGLLVRVRSTQDHRDGNISLGTDREPFRSISDDNSVDDPWRGRLKIHDAHGIHAAVGST